MDGEGEFCGVALVRGWEGARMGDWGFLFGLSSLN